MGQPFTIEISTDLVRRLVDDGENIKKKTRKPKSKINRKPQEPETVLPKRLSDNSKSPWPIQPPPLYLPTPTPQKSPANAELDAIWSVLEASEKVVEKLQNQEENMLNEVTRRAKQLHDQEFKLPNSKLMPCLDEKDACLKCYKENTNDPLKCARLVEGFADCARRVRQQIAAQNN